MDCTTNAFCGTLPAETRRQLCAKCNRRLLKARSFQLYRDFERDATLVLDGALTSSIHAGEDVLNYSKDVPAFYLAIPGRILATNVTFKRDEKMYYGENSMEYLTDCCIATFKHGAIEEFFYNNKDFARSMVLSMIRIMEDACEVSAILRAESTYASVHHMMRYLSGHRIYLTQQQIADIVNRDRASVSKAMSRVKDNSPRLYSEYLENKGRVVEMYNPAD